MINKLQIALIKIQGRLWCEKAFKTPQFELGALAGYWMARAEEDGANIPGNGIVERSKNYWRQN